MGGWLGGGGRNRPKEMQPRPPAPLHPTHIFVTKKMKHIEKQQPGYHKICDFLARDETENGHQSGRHGVGSDDICPKRYAFGPHVGPAWSPRAVLFCSLYACKQSQPPEASSHAPRHMRRRDKCSRGDPTNLKLLVTVGVAGGHWPVASGVARGSGLVAWLVARWIKP